MDLIHLILSGLVAALVALAYFIYKWQSYFKNNNVPYIKSNPFLGSLCESMIGKCSFYDNVSNMYHNSEVKDNPFFGFFILQKPVLMLKDPELIKRILLKDFNSFSNRHSHSELHDPLGHYNLFTIKNPLWKKLRVKLTPFFSSGKLKNMFYILDKISSDLMDHIKKTLNNEGYADLEAREIAALYSTDVIASCAYGVDAKSLENPSAEFRTVGKAIFNFTIPRAIGFFGVFFVPDITKLSNFKVFTEYGSKFIKDTVTYVMGEREKTGTKRNDLIDTLIELKQTDPDLSMDVLMAQAAVFFIAGYETSSTTQSFAMYELAKNQEIQNRVKAEIRKMLKNHDGKITYDGVMNETPYLHQVIMETLRIYPILPVLDRECINPDGYPLEPFSDFKIPPGMPVYIPIYPIQRDEKYFPDPLKFDPERFAPENKDNIVPFTHLPFGNGSRNCIGERFGLMQVKTAVIKILTEYRFERSPSTPDTITLDKKAMIPQPDVPLKLRFVRDPL